MPSFRTDRLWAIFVAALISRIMKKIFVFLCVHLCLIFLCLAINAQEFKTVQDGIEYAEMTREIDKVPVKMNLLRLDLTKVRLDVVHAMDAAIGVEKTSSIATRHGAFAAINAGFFRLDTSIFAGDAAGVLQIDGKLLSETYNNRVALFISNQNNSTQVEIGHLNLSDKIRIKGYDWEISGINRERKENEIIIFTPEFGRTTLTNSDGAEFVVQKNRISQIIKSNGSNLIPAVGYVISANGKQGQELLKKAKIGAKVERFTFESNSMKVSSSTSNIVNNDLPKTNFFKTEDITNGVPQLIKDGKIEITWEQEKASKSFYETRHPRTAVAKLKDGKFLMITVDGRSEASGGIGLEDLAKLLLELGATDAMNLDGGGSTTMFLDGKVVNKPSDKDGERRVSDAILVFPRKK